MSSITVYSKVHGSVSVKIDFDDLNKIKDYKWYIHKTRNNFYIRGCKNKKFIYLHRLVMNAQKGQYVDHINHNTFDNRKCNLRLCSIKQNGMNARKQKRKTSSKYKGVTFYKRDKKWQAKIHVDGKTVHLGYFDNEIDAANAYDTAAVKYFKNFANLNTTK